MNQRLPTLRQQEALKLRESGLTFREVGERLGVSKERASQLVKRNPYGTKSMRHWLKATREKAIAKLGGKCSVCGEVDYIVLQIDHIIPVAKTKEKRRAGPELYSKILKNQQDNVQVLCANCHARKTRLDGKP